MKSFSIYFVVLVQILIEAKKHSIQMKLFLQILMMLCFVAASGQKLVISGKTAKLNKIFHFDYLVHYTSESDGRTRDVLGYINSENPNYVLKIFKNSENITFAKLFSDEDKETFNFKVKESKSKGEIVFGFEYEDSSFLGYKFVENHKSQYVKIDDHTLKLEIFKNKKATKIWESHTLKTKPHNQSLYSAYKAFFVHHSELGDKMMGYPENVFVEESVIDCENGSKVTVKLQEIRNVDLNIKIP